MPKDGVDGLGFLDQMHTKLLSNSRSVVHTSAFWIWNWVCYWNIRNMDNEFKVIATIGSR
jgi:hypothetical protein